MTLFSKTIINTALCCASSLFLASCDKPPEQETSSVTISSITTDSSSNDSTFQSMQGQAIEISDFSGQKVLLNYWATWCAPCIREIPSLNRAASILEDEGFVFLFASDESIEDISEFVNERGFDGTFIKLNSFFASSGVEAVPSTLLFNEKGSISNSWLGEYEWDSQEMLKQLRDAN